MTGRNSPRSPRPALGRPWSVGLLASLLLAMPVAAEPVRVGVAANFLATAEALAREWQAASGEEVVLAGGSSGQLYAQIANGAPFDLFLAADAERPVLLVEKGLAIRSFPYAVGRLALCGAGSRGGAARLEEMAAAAGGRLALANPGAAPYGLAAVETLDRLGLRQRLEARLVYGESVAQALQFVRSGNAELGIVALSQTAAGTPPPGPEADLECRSLPETLHAPIRQDAAVLTARGEPFAAYLRGPEAAALLAAAGYGAATGGDGSGPPRARSDGAPSSVTSPVWLTLRLAAVSTLVLLLVGTPLAWWLAGGPSAPRTVVEALVALPLVLPPTVLGFYLLVLLGPQGAVGRLWEALGGARLVFSFGGLVVGSVVYSLPFVVQPLQNAFQAVDPRLLEAAATLRAGPWDRFRSIVVPLARRGFLTAAVLAFAHTVGEFGIVLMIGGAVPERTRVLSVAVFEHVERLEYAAAHRLSAGLIAFSFAVLLAVYAWNRRGGRLGG